MSNREITSSRSPTKGFNFGLQPLPAWSAILGFVLFSALCLLIHAGSILRLTYPLLALAVAVFLYLRYPILYMGFTWWMWFLTPLATRLADYQSGWDAQRLMMVSPYLVTLVTLATFCKHLPRSYREGGLPFLLAFTGVIYGFLVGLIMNSPAAAARSLLDWLSPITFGFHIFIHWRDYPTYRQNIQRIFLWGVLIVGSYGIIQYVVAPEWDRFWLVTSKMTSSAGRPEPFGFRLWSTMTEPAACGYLMMAGGLLLFNSKASLRIPAVVVGYITLLLTLVRTLWGAWMVGLITLIISLKPQLQMRLIITILMIVVCIVPLTTVLPFSDSITSRLQSFSDLENDTSANDRKALYQGLINRALSEGFGQGLGSGEAIDSGILVILLTFGWFGTIFYLSGIILLLFNLLQSSEGKIDPFASAARAISLGLIGIIFFSSPTLSTYGMFFWGFSALGMSASKYYKHQRTIEFKRELSS